MSSVRLVLTTAPDREAARALARTLVAQRLAACCNLVGGVDSVYRWEGAVREEGEVLLVIKTSAVRLAELERALLTRHPYAVPELVVLLPERVEPRYAAWVEAESAPAVDAGE
jgi:periplasmic divalent cation tolerance protein